MAKYKIEEWPILDPHAVIHFLFDKAKIKIPQEHVRRYWQHHAAGGEEWAQDPRTHEMIPLGIFGDSARVTKEFGSVNVVGLFLSIVLFRPRSVRASRFLLFSIGEEELWKHHTLNTVYRRITWSLNALFDGLHPELDPYGRELEPRLQQFAGQPITQNNLRFCITEIRGDWSWQKKIWRFRKTSWVAINICHWCRAKSKGQWADLYWNFGEQSSWCNNEFTVEEFMDEKLPLTGICTLHDSSKKRFCPFFLLGGNIAMVQS